MDRENKKLSRSIDKNRLEADASDPNKTEEQDYRGCVINNANCGPTNKNDRFRNYNRPIPPQKSSSEQNVQVENRPEHPPLRRHRSLDTKMPSETISSSRLSLGSSKQPTVIEEPGTSSENKDTDDDCLAMRKK